MMVGFQITCLQECMYTLCKAHKTLYTILLKPIRENDCMWSMCGIQNNMLSNLSEKVPKMFFKSFGETTCMSDWQKTEVG